jgi:hypothetical protein
LTCMHSYARVLFLLFGGIGGIVNVQEPWPCFCQHGPKRWYWCVKMWSMQETYMISLQNLSWFRLFLWGMGFDQWFNGTRRISVYVRHVWVWQAIFWVCCVWGGSFILYFVFHQCLAGQLVPYLP